MKAAIFLDRDGVLLPEQGLVTDVASVRLLPSVPRALQQLKAAGFLLIAVTNQSVIARGLIKPAQLDKIHAQMCRLLQEQGSPPLDAIYVCPHHPQANLPEYHVECDCRKPRPGMLLRAAREHNLDLAASTMIGDQITDIMAGVQAGCKTVLVRSPATLAKPIVTPDQINDAINPDYICNDLLSATDWILSTP